MSSPVANRMNRIKPGMCPHGMPAGACPICNGMGGASAKKSQNVRKPGEMTWSECFAMGLRMKADKLHKQKLIQDRRDMHLASLKLQEVLSDKNQKLLMLLETISKTFPAPVAKILSVPVKVLFIPILKVMNFVVINFQNLQVNIANFVENMNKFMQGVQEKLAAILGEFVNAKEKTLFERFKLARKKVFGLFFSKSVDDEEISIKEIEREEMYLSLRKIKDMSFELSKYSQEVENELDSAV